MTARSNNFPSTRVRERVSRNTRHQASSVIDRAVTDTDATDTATRTRVREDLFGAIISLIADEVAARLSPALAPSTALVEDWRLLNVDEAAERLGRSTRWVRERVKRGELDYVKLDGGALAFELDDLREFADRRRVALAGRLQPNGDAASVRRLRGADRVGYRRVA
jgi:excisionase family DNA binding protein